MFGLLKHFERVVVAVLLDEDIANFGGDEDDDDDQDYNEKIENGSFCEDVELSFQSEDANKEINENLARKIERLHLHLSLSQRIDDIVDALHAIENHSPIEDQGETDEIVHELVLDIQKKCSQFIRSNYADQVRQSIVFSRKRLAMKTATDAESAMQHNQRHLHVLIELLGSWSNAIMELQQKGLSLNMLKLIVSPLHDRVMEMAVEIFKNFQEDKKLDHLQTKVQEETAAISLGNHGQGLSPKPDGSYSGKGNFSLSTLDLLLSQISAMREVMTKYHQFYRDMLCNDEAGDETTVTPFHTPSTSSKPSKAASEIHQLWREYDFMYMVLEVGYLSRSMLDALNDSSLVHVHGDAFIPQAVEDCFYILQKVCERSIGLATEGVILGLGNKIVEQLDPMQDSILYKLVSQRVTYYQCYQQDSHIGFINTVYLSMNEKRRSTDEHFHTPNNNLKNVPQTPLKRDLNKNGVSESNQVIDGSTISHSLSLSNIVGETVGNEIGSELAELVDSATLLADVATTSFKGVNAWIQGFRTPAQPSNQKISSAPSSGNGKKPESQVYQTPHQKSVKPSPPASLNGNRNVSSTNLEDLILSALEDEAMNESRVNIYEVEDEEIVLGNDDECVALSTSAAVVTSIESLIGAYSALFDDDNGGHLCTATPLKSSSSSPLNLIVQELRRVKSLYEELWQEDCYSYANAVLQEHVLPKLRSVFSRSFEIDGDTLEELNTSAPISSIFRGLFDDADVPGCSGVFNSKVRRKLIYHAFIKVLDNFADITSSYFTDFILQTNFSEWGAIFLQHEPVLVTCSDCICRILAHEAIGTNISYLCTHPAPLVSQIMLMIRYFDKFTEDIETNVHSKFTKLIWITKILILDQPSDIRRYQIPVNDLQEIMIRNVMSRRIEFSKDAVQKVKLSFTS